MCYCPFIQRNPFFYSSFIQFNEDAYRQFLSLIKSFFSLSRDYSYEQCNLVFCFFVKIIRCILDRTLHIIFKLKMDRLEIWSYFLFFPLFWLIFTELLNRISKLEFLEYTLQLQIYVLEE